MATTFELLTLLLAAAGDGQLRQLLQQQPRLPGREGNLAGRVRGARRLSDSKEQFLLLTASLRTREVYF